jgi:ribosomal protein S18 acetylase RimI-like enzyme
MTDPNAVTIRSVRPEDVPTICDIAVAAWRPIHDCYREQLGEELYALWLTGWEERKASEVRAHAEAHPEWTLVAELPEGVVGFVTFRIGSDRASRLGHIGNNAVAPGHQGRSIGRMLYERAMEWMRKQGVEWVELVTGLDDGHAPARRAYERCGFRQAMPSVHYVRRIEEA